MGNQVFKEPFIEKYDGVASPIHVPIGGLSHGLNLRRISAKGGWKARKGCTLHNTTAVDSTNAVKSLHQYTNPKNSDYHFIAQCNSLLYNSANDPPTGGTTFGTSLGVTVGTTPGFSCMVGALWIYADGSGSPIIYGGTNVDPLAVLYKPSATTLSFIDFTGQVIDYSTSTYAYIKSTADQTIYIITMEPASGFVVTLGGTVNDAAAVLTVSAIRSGTWTAVSGLSDGTNVSGDSMKQSGTISYTASSSDTLYTIGRTMGYCYRLTWGAQLDDVHITSLKVIQAAHSISNKWNGAYEVVTGALFDDNSATERFKEVLGYVSSESTSTYVDIGAGTTSDFLYLGTPERTTGYLFGIVNGYANTNNAEVDLIEYTAADGDWEDITTLSDRTIQATSSFATTGAITFDGNAVRTTWQQRQFGRDNTSMFWSRISWDATLSADCRIYFIGYIPYPEPLGAYNGCVEFKGRLILWGDRTYPNRLRYSALDRPDCFSGIDSGYSQAFGSGDYILCARNFYNELLIWKKDSIWMLEGFDRATFGSLRITDEVGLASPQTAKVAEVGVPGMSSLEPRSVALWEDTDGVYILDGSKPRKVSLPVDQFFNPDYTSCIPAADINNLSAEVDPINNTYHLLFPNAIDYYGDGSLYVTEIVYNYANDEWYPPWYRAINLSCALSFKGTDNRDYFYGASSSGFVMRLNNDTSDKNTSNADVAIRQILRTRGIGTSQKETTTARTTLRHLWPEFKAQSAGTPTIGIYGDKAITITSLGTASMIKSGKGITAPLVAASESFGSCFQAEFELNTIDQEMEIYGMLYELEGVGLPNY